MLPSVLGTCTPKLPPVSFSPLDWEPSRYFLLTKNYKNSWIHQEIFVLLRLPNYLCGVHNWWIWRLQRISELSEWILVLSKKLRFKFNLENHQMSKVVCKFLPDIIYWKKMQLLLLYCVHIVSNTLARNFHVLLFIDNFIEKISLLRIKQVWIEL